MNMGLVGGLMGSALGIALGLFGMYWNTKHTKGPREHAFMVKSTIVCFLGILIFVALLLAVPYPYRWLIWIPYIILLPIGIIYGHRTQQRISREEAQNKDSDR